MEEIIDKHFNQDIRTKVCHHSQLRSFNDLCMEKAARIYRRYRDHITSAAVSTSDFGKTEKELCDVMLLLLKLASLKCVPHLPMFGKDDQFKALRDLIEDCSGDKEYGKFISSYNFLEKNKKWNSDAKGYCQYQNEVQKIYPHDKAAEDWELLTEIDQREKRINVACHGYVLNGR